MKNEIKNLITEQINTVALITSAAGTVRSNHYHKTGSHRIFIISGKMRYIERLLESKAVIIDRVVQPGEMVFTGPLSPHRCEFLDDTVMLSFDTNLRDKANQDEDVVKIEW